MRSPLKPIILTAAVCFGILIFAPFVTKFQNGIVTGQIPQGTGILIATIFAGAGWAVKQLIEERRSAQTVAQAYIATIEAHAEEFEQSMSDVELDRFALIAPKIRSGREKETIPVRPVDPFVNLPSFHEQASLLSANTIKYLQKWRHKGAEMFVLYDLLGSKQLSELSQDRIAIYYDYMKKFRDEYFEIGLTAGRLLENDVPGVALSRGTTFASRKIAIEIRKPRRFLVNLLLAAMITFTGFEVFCWSVQGFFGIIISLIQAVGAHATAILVD